MHKYRLCTLSLQVAIRPNGPILIKSPHAGAVDPAIPDMSFVRTHSPFPHYPGMTVYLPGSSLKGVLRSYCEGIGRALGLQPPVCDPFDEKSQCRQEPHTHTPLPVPQRYQRSCPICRLFGSTCLGGRIAIADAYPTPDTVAMVNTTSYRTGVGIDRLLGSTHKGALYDFEVVERGAFLVHLKLENFEFWQVGLLALALRDLHTGNVRLGLGTSRGMGFVHAEIQTARVSYTGWLTSDNGLYQLHNRTGMFPLNDEQSCQLYGVAELVGPEASAYNMRAGTAIAIPLGPERVEDEGVVVSMVLKSPQFPSQEPLQQFFAGCVERLQREISSTQPSPGVSVGEKAV